MSHSAAVLLKQYAVTLKNKSTFFACFCDISSMQFKIRRVIVLVQDGDRQRDVWFCRGAVDIFGNSCQLQGYMVRTGC